MDTPPPEKPGINVGGLTGNIGVAIGHGSSATVNLVLPTPAQVLYQIPDAPTDFVGRDTELAELLQAASSDGALVFGVHGMGRVGKTALAYRLAQALRSDYPDAHLLVELHGLAEQGHTSLTPAQATTQVVRAWRPADPKVDKDEVKDRVERIEQEASTQESASESKLERWLGDLAWMAPDIFNITVAALTSPVTAVTTIVRKVAQKAKADAPGS
jgi:hypothetical protein